MDGEILKGPVALDFLTSSTVVVGERTSLSLIELQTKVKTLLIGSSTVGGYVDGNSAEARFSYINDVAIQGNIISRQNFPDILSTRNIPVALLRILVIRSLGKEHQFIIL